MKLFDREKFELAWNWMISDLIAIARRQPNWLQNWRQWTLLEFRTGKINFATAPYFSINILNS